jgi:hypothetical protein
VGQAAGVTEDPTKIGLLWSAEWLLQLRDIGQIRAHLDGVLSNVLLLPTFPAYVSGFLLALGFTPLVGRLVVELVSKAFERLPDDMLMPWLPSLIMALRPLGADLVATLVKDAAACFPSKLAGLEGWTPPWDAPVEEAGGAAPTAAAAEANAAATSLALSPEEAAVRALVVAHPAAANALGAVLGEAPAWAELLPTPIEAAVAPAGEVAAPPADSPAAKLLEAYPAAARALGVLCGEPANR